MKEKTRDWFIIIINNPIYAILGIFYFMVALIILSLIIWIQIDSGFKELISLSLMVSGIIFFIILGKHMFKIAFLKNKVKETPAIILISSILILPLTYLISFIFIGPGCGGNPFYNGDCFVSVYISFIFIIGPLSLILFITGLIKLKEINKK